MKPKPVKQKKAHKNESSFGFTVDQIKLLNRLNDLLTQKEKELLERCKSLFEAYEKRLAKNGGDLSDFEMDVVVEYMATDFHPKYCFNVFVYKTMFDDRERVLASGINWMEAQFPELNERWCYLMHRLYEEAYGSKSLYKIVEVNFEIVIREQQFVKLAEYERFF